MPLKKFVFSCVCVTVMAVFAALGTGCGGGEAAPCRPTAPTGDVERRVRCLFDKSQDALCLWQEIRAGVGVELNLPIDRLRERNDYRATLIDFEV